MINKTLIQEFPHIIKKIHQEPLEQVTLPFSNSNLKRLETILNLYSNSLQNILFFNHNNFEINVLMEGFKESNPEEIGKLSLEIIERIFIQFFAVFEISKSMKFNFIDFGRFQILNNYNIKFPIALTETKEFQLKDALEFFQNNKNFKDLHERNYRNFFDDICCRYKFNENKCYLYRYSDFSSNILNSYHLSDLRSDSNIKIRIKTVNDIQKKIIKKNLYNKFFSDDILFINFDKDSENICRFISGLFRKQHGCGQDDFIKVINELRYYLKGSSFQSIVLIVDQLKAKEDIEFIKYLLDSAGISNLIFIYFGDEDFIDFDLEFKENPVNLLKEYLMFEEIEKKVDLVDEEKRILKVFKCLPFSIPKNDLSKVFSNKEQEQIEQLIAKKYLNIISGKIKEGVNFFSLNLKVTEAEEKEILKLFLESFDSLSLKIKYNIKFNRPKELKNTLIKYKSGSLEGNFQNIKKIILDNWSFFESDIELITLYLEILIKENDLDSAKELALKYKNENPSLINVKLSHIYWLERNYQKMNETLKKVKKVIPHGLMDEFNYLKFAYFEKISDLKQADRYLKKIKNEMFVNISNIQISDRYIYDGKYDKAEILIKNVINYFESKKNYKYEIEARSQWAKLLREKEAFKDAEELYKSLYLKSEIKNYQLLSAYILVDLGNLYLIQDDFNQAEFWYKKALKIFQDQGNENGVILAESNLVEVNKPKGDWQEIEKYLKIILKYDKEKNLIVSLAIDYFNIAHLRYLRNDSLKALRYIDKAIALFKKSKKLTNIVECEFLRLKINMLNPSYCIEFNFLKKKLNILTNDQRMVLSIFETCQKDGRNNEFSSIIEKKIKGIGSVTIQYELISILIRRYRILEFLDSLKSLSMQLSKKTKNFYYYDFYYLYFDIFSNYNEIDDEKRRIFFDVYYFFLRNKRKMSSKIIHLKNFLDKNDSISDIFKSFELVGDYIHWKIPEDFFKSFVIELEKIIKIDLVKLVIYEKEKRVFQFSNQNKFNQLTEEIVSKLIVSLENLNLTLQDIKDSYESEEKAFYFYNNTKVILWKISESLTGVLFMAFLTKDYFNYDLYERNSDLLIKFGSLISKYYENDYKLNKKLGFIIGESIAIKKLKKHILKISKVDFSVLIEGESGSGKELVAKAIHLLSNRETKPFIPVNSAAIPENLLEAELFGYKKGAFTGASEDKMGLIEAADGGTLFLDEIADLPLNLQAKLLRVLQEGEIRRVGENRSIKVNVRLISATNKDLRELIKNNQFREDLFFRIQDLSIKVPPLRDRVEDIPLLTEYFLKKNGFPIKDKMEFQTIVEYLKGREWKGNVRELESSIKRLITYYPDFEMEDNIIYDMDTGLISARENLEKSMIYKTLRENNWNKVNTAKALKISRVYLFNLMKKYNITRDT